MQATPTTKTAKSETIRVRVTPEIRRWLERAARNAHLDISDVVRQHLAQGYEARKTT